MADSRYSILVVDDDEMTRALHAEFVRALGYSVEVAADGMEGLAKLDPGIDLVLTDAHMPNLDGFEFVRRIRTTLGSDELPIVMVTSLEAREDRLRALEVGINDFVNKPLDPVELRLRLRSLLELKTAQDRLRRSKDDLERTVDERTRELLVALEDVRRAEREIHSAHLDTIRRLTLAAEYKDSLTAGHIERIGRYSEVVGIALNLAPAFVELLLHATPMHDVGKLGIPDHILLKPGPLTPDERAIIQTHTTIGGEILSGSTSAVIQMGERVARTHHERWDGSGYPDGLAGDEIPIEARICSVVDAFDALTMDRPYHRAMPAEDAAEIIRDQRGTTFDAQIVDAFLEVRDDLERIRVSYPSE
jgi:putative two-component system response regulator